MSNANMSIDVIPTELVDNQTKIHRIIDNICQTANNLLLNSEMAFKKATGLVRQAKDWIKIVEEERKKHNAPDQSRINERNDRAKTIVDPLKEAIRATEVKLGAYQRGLEEQKAKEDAYIREAAKILGETDEIYIPEADKTLRGDGLLVISKQVKRFKVTDVEKVPRAYLVVDEKAVETAIKLGINEIPGISIYEETVTQTRSR